MRAELVGKMVDSLAVEGGWAAWLPLLAQVGASTVRPTSAS
jgi:hypothetical protein